MVFVANVGGLLCHSCNKHHLTSMVCLLYLMVNHPSISGLILALIMHHFHSLRLGLRLVIAS
ncbi:hypothetical protein LINPERHAP2_LOCUS10577 [Linum perenne]